MQQPRTKLTDAQWRRLRPLLPGKPAAPGRAGFDNRKTVEGILWIARAGAPGPLILASGTPFTSVSASGLSAGALPGCWTLCKRVCTCVS